MYNFDEFVPKKDMKKTETPLFIGSYPPIAPPGQRDGFFVNTYFLQPDRKSELKGAVPVRSHGKCS